MASKDKNKSHWHRNDGPPETSLWATEGRKGLTHRASEFLWNMKQDLDSLAKEYTSLLEGFLSQLPVQQHVDLKFLMFRLDFTEFYSRLGLSKS